MSKFLLTMHVDLLDEHADEAVLLITNQLEERLSSSDLGRFVGSGGGMNQVDITYLVEKPELAQQVMEESLQALKLRANHSFLAEEFHGDEATYFDDIEGISVSKLTYFFGLLFFLIVSLLYVAWAIVMEIRG